MFAVVTAIRTADPPNSQYGNLSVYCDTCLNMAEPIEIITMKIANTSPYGTSSPVASNAGVHKNTNVYMAPKNSDCVMPRIQRLSSMLWRPFLKPVSTERSC